MNGPSAARFADMGMRKIGEHDGVNLKDISLLCSIACLIPWTSFFVFSEAEKESQAKDYVEEEMVRVDDDNSSRAIMRSMSCDEYGEERE